MERFKTMFGVFAIVGAALTVLSAGNASAQSCLCNQEVVEHHEFKVWVPGPSTFIAGPGAGTSDVMKSGFGSLAVYDVPANDGPDENDSNELGRCRGQFLVNSLDGTNILMFFTFDFVNDKFNGSLVVAGSMDYSGETCTVPVLGGTGAFASAKGFIKITPVAKPSGGEWGQEVLETLMICEGQVTVSKSEPILIQSNPGSLSSANRS